VIVGEGALSAPFSFWPDEGMITQLPISIGEPYNSPAQKIRVITESWAAENVFCPSCLALLKPTPRNHPATDFYCEQCGHLFELKSTRGRFGGRVVDGAYSTMTARISAGTQPNLLLLAYSPALLVDALFVIPRFFLTPEIVEKRKPLAASARRAGWVGCNLLIGRLPPDGRIAYVSHNQAIPREQVRQQWRRSIFVDQVRPQSRGWLVAVMSRVRALEKQEFSLADVYRFEEDLQKQFPSNRNIRPKIRQQLQLLRDNGWLTFEGSGTYRLTNKPRAEQDAQRNFYGEDRIDG